MTNPVVNDFLREWDLPPILGTQELPAGAVNRVHRVETTEGVYFLRIYKSTDPATLDREHALIHQVLKHEIPAARPLKTKSGHSYASKNNKLAALYTQAQGDQLSENALTLVQAKAAGEMLARIHHATQGFPNYNYRVYNLQWDNAAWIEKLNSIEALILNKKNLSESDQWALERLRGQRAWLGNSYCSHSYVPKFSSQVLHGDYHNGNLFFGPDSVQGVIDWDQSTFMPRAFEVVRAASYMFGFEGERALAFVNAYRQHFPLSFAELEDGALGWGHRADHYVWAIEEIYLHGNERARVFIPHRPFKPFGELWADLKPKL